MMLQQEQARRLRRRHRRERIRVQRFLEHAFDRLELDWHKYVEADPRYFRPAEVDLLQGDASKARRVLGWKPQVNFEQLVAMMVEADLELAESEQRSRGR